MNSGLDDISEQQSRHIRKALNNWRAVWNRRLSIDRADRGSIAIFDVSIEPEGEIEPSKGRYNRQETSGLATNINQRDSYHEKDWRRPGFWRHASEYWLLANLFVEKMVSAERGIEAVENPPTGRSSSCQVEMKILSRYGDTDMSTLHEFLSSRMPIRKYSSVDTAPE
jgi:hypothetical protein